MESEPQYDAYKANSRSVELPNLPASLSKPQPLETKKITREDLPVEGARAFVLHNFLLPFECKFFVDATEEIGYEKNSDLAGEYPPEYRNNHRLISISHELAGDIWSRLQPQLQFKDIHSITPLGFATEGLWLPSGINEAFLFSRYKPGQYFKPHYDGMYKNEHQEVSIFTITIYLNDDYAGGSVKFLRSREDPTEVYSYQPKQGDAVIFNHDVFHEGEEVRSNSKYILRSCIMFRRVSNLVDPSKPWENDPLWHNMREEFAKFNELRKENDPKKFTETFLRLQQIQLEHGRSIKNTYTSMLPFEILIEIFEKMDLVSFVRISVVCKAWHSIGIHGRLWRNLYVSRWGNTTATYMEKSAMESPDVVNWKGKYQTRYMIEQKGVEPLILFTGEKVWAQKGQYTIDNPQSAAAERQYDPWDMSFDGWSVGDGYPYMVDYGKLGYSEHAIFSAIFSHAKYVLRRVYRDSKKPNKKFNDDFPVTIVVTNRLAWGDKKIIDYTIGHGERDEKDRENEVDDPAIMMKAAKLKYQLQVPIDPTITCINEFNAFVVALAIIPEHDARTISFIDRSLCAAISKNFSSALVICEEHEFANNPAQLVAVPISKYQIQRQHEKHVEVFYDINSTKLNEEVAEKVVEAIREIATLAGGSTAFDGKIILQYEAQAEHSFLRSYESVISAKLQRFGLTVVVATMAEVLQAANDFCYGRDFFKKSTLFKNYG